jgi:DNA repair protein RadC
MKEKLSIVSEVQLVYRTKVTPSERPQLKSSKEAFKLIFDTWDRDTIELYEEVKLLLLNRSNRVLGLVSLSKGGQSGSIIDVRLVFAYAIKASAQSILIVHNHPSGATSPSDSDKKITDKLQSAGRIMDISLLDHLIITPDGNYFSFADEGIL